MKDSLDIQAFLMISTTKHAIPKVHVAPEKHRQVTKLGFSTGPETLFEK